MKKTPTKNSSNEQEKLLLSEISFLLSEKRTYLSLLRTGIAVFGVPITVLALLLATDGVHQVFQKVWLAFIIVSGLTIVALFGLWVFFYAEKKILKINRMVEKIEKENKRIAELVL